MMTPIRAATFAVALATFAPPVYGQPNNDDTQSNARIRLGPLAVNPTIAVTKLGVDTNVFNETSDPKRDFTTSIAPQLETRLRLGPARLSHRSTAEFVYFQRYQSERSLNSDHEARVEFLFNRVRPFTEASFLSSRQRPGYEIDARAQRQERSIMAGGGIRLIGATWLELAAHRSRIEFDPDATFLGTALREVLNRDVERVTASVRFVLTPLTTIVVSADTQRDRFALSPIRNSKSLRVIPGIEFDSRALISGRAFVGYRRFEALSSGIPGYRGLTGSIDLAYTLMGSTKFSVRADRDVNHSFEILHPYYLLTGVAGSISRVLIRPWDMQLGWGRQQLDYRDIGALDGADGRIDRIHKYGAGLGYRVGRDSRIAFDVDYYRRQSPSAGRRYDSLQAGVSVTYGL